MKITSCSCPTDATQRELVNHGSLPFPIACYDDDLTFQTVPLHWHDEFEYILAIEGSLTLFLENTHLPLYPGEGIFINAGVLHAVEKASDGCAFLHSAVFHPRLIGGSADSVFWQQLVQPLLKDAPFHYQHLIPYIPWQQKILTHFADVWDALAHEPDDYENFVRYELSRALRILNQHRPANTKAPSEQERLNASRIRTMLMFIEEHYADDLAIGDIAASVSISASACLRCFNQTLGITPIQYLKQFRLDRASELLKNSRKTAKEVAFECGFNDVSYFIKTFREKKGQTPKKYQQTHTILTTTH